MAASQQRLVRVFIKGTVQQVGFRMWAEREALMLGVEGWVRNRADGSVESVFAGEPDAVDSLVEACSRGPAKARVASVEIAPASASDLDLRSAGALFDVLPTV